MPLPSLYAENILDHYKHPRNKGRTEGAELHRRESNPLCGDVIEIFARLDDAGKIAEIKFDGEGCAISQAAASMLTEMAEGKSVEELMLMDKREMLDALGVHPGPARIKCALLAFKTLKMAAFEHAGRKADEETKEM